MHRLANQAKGFESSNGDEGLPIIDKKDNASIIGARKRQYRLQLLVEADLIKSSDPASCACSISFYVVNFCQALDSQEL